MRTTKFDFVGLSKRWTALSLVLIVVSLAALGIRGLDLSIDFVGGTSFTLDGISDDVTAQDVNEAVEAAGAEEVVTQLRGPADAPTGAVVRTESFVPASEEALAIEEALREVAQPDDLTFSFVGPNWGQRVTAQALQALVVFLVVVMLYISVRLDRKMALASLVALGHDVLITIGLYALVGFPVSPATVIALLTILGYSLYDTVVVFDRVDENAAYLGQPGFRSLGQLVNTSMNEVLWRSINTSVTSLLPVGALLIIGAQVLGATTLQDLALALFLGMAVGIYSSIFVAGPFYAWLRHREPEMQELAADAARSLGKDQAWIGDFEAPVPEADAGTVLSADPEVLAAIAAGEAEVDRPAETPRDPRSGEKRELAEHKAPVTTEYVRGQGKKKRRKR
jgi:preprotein translocase subunit SecF